MSVSSRVSAFLLLGLVVLAAALLVAGYGAAVGVGVIAGLLLGLATILAFLAMRPHVRGSSMAWLDSAAGPSARPSGQDLIERHHHDWMRVAGVDSSRLRRVIAVGTKVETAGVRLELIALEVRADGGIASVVAQARPPVGQAGHFVTVSVNDDAGTEYAAAGQGSGGGNVGTSRYDMRFAPAPPANSRVLTIRVDSFLSPFPGPIIQLDGPWEFHIALD